MTTPKAKKQMKAIEQDFVSQLISLYRTSVKGTRTGQSIQSWTASSVPLDDSVREIQEIVVRVRRAPKGNEGAIVTLEKDGVQAGGLIILERGVRKVHTTSGSLESMIPFKHASYCFEGVRITFN